MTQFCRRKHCTNPLLSLLHKRKLTARALRRQGIPPLGTPERAAWDTLRKLTADERAELIARAKAKITFLQLWHEHPIGRTKRHGMHRYA